MKNLFKSMMLVAAAAMGFSACSNDATEEFTTPDNGSTKLITVTTDITRTTLDADRNKLIWSAQDEFGVFTDVASDKNIASGTYSEAEDGNYTLKVDNSATMIYAYYPISTYNNSRTAQTVSIEIKKEQNGTKGVFDGQYMPMIAKGAIEGSTVNLSFTPVACALALNVCNGEEDEQITKITFTSAEQNCGYDNAGNDITADELNYVGYNTTATLNVTGDAPANGAIPTTAAEKQHFENQLYLVVARKEYAAGAVFTVTTTKSTYTFTTKKALDCSNVDFMPVTLKLEPKEVEPENTNDFLLETYGDFQTGDKVIFTQVFSTSTNTTIAMGAQNGSYRAAIKNVNRVGTAIPYQTVKDNDIAILEVVAGTTAGTYAFKDTATGQYLYYSGSSNSVYSGATIEDNAYYWKVQASVTGKATVTNVKTTGRTLKYNSSSPRFACYTSGQVDISIFRQKSDTPEVQTPTIAVYSLEAPIVGEEAGMSSNLFEVRNSDSAVEVINIDNVVVTEALVDGNDLYYEITPNYTGAERKGSITLALVDDPEVTATINVTQAADEFRAETEKVRLGNTAESEVKIKIYSSYPWEITTEDDSYLVDPTTYDGSNKSYKEITIMAMEDNNLEEVIELGSFVITRTTGDTDPNKTLTIEVSQAAGSSTGGGDDNGDMIWISDVANVSAGQYYIATPDGHLYNGAIKSGHLQVTTSTATVTDNIVTNIPEDAVLVTFTATGTANQYELVDAYGKYINVTKAGSGGFALGATLSTKWTFNNNANGLVAIGSNYAAHFRGYSNNSFRSYANDSSGTEIYLVKVK